MEEKPIVPLFAYPPVGPRLTIKDLARDIAAAGVPLETARARAAGFAKHRLIHVREAGQRTSPNIYEFSDDAAAIVLSALQDGGIADHEVLQAASLALYSWSAKAQFRDWIYKAPDQKHLPRHPIDRAVIGLIKRESWSFSLNVWRDSQTGERIVDADLHRLDTDFIGHRDISATATPRAAIVVTIDDMLQPVIRRLLPSAAN